MPIWTFEVIVRGRLSPTLLAAFGEFKASHVDGGLTCLIGHDADQDALWGLFRLLQDLSIELVSVNPVGEARIWSSQANEKTTPSKVRVIDDHPE